MFDFSVARAHMVESQIRTADVTDRRLLGGFKTVPREKFTPQTAQALAYGDTHIETDEGRWLIRPRDFAMMVNVADIQPTDVVLDIACGRGYSAAVLASMAETVVGLETSDEAVTRAEALLEVCGVNNAAVVKGELKSGASEHGPFDVIFVNGAVSSPSKSWLDQLTSGGRLICVIADGALGRCHVYTRTGDIVGERIAFDATLPTLPGFEREDAFVF